MIYETAGLYLTVRGKALEGGTEGDVVSVLNLQSKRTVTGTVVGRGQVSVSVATPRPTSALETAAPETTESDTTSSIAPDQPAAPVALATNTNHPQVVPKSE